MKGITYKIKCFEKFNLVSNKSIPRNFVKGSLAIGIPLSEGLG